MGVGGVGGDGGRVVGKGEGGGKGEEGSKDIISEESLVGLSAQDLIRVSVGFKCEGIGFECVSIGFGCVGAESSGSHSEGQE